MSDETVQPQPDAPEAKGLRYICATRDPSSKNGYCTFESDDGKLALQHQAANSHNVIDRVTGAKLGTAIVQKLRFICTKPNCGFEAEYVDQARKHHQKTGDHRVVDRVQGVPVDHDLAGTQWIQAAQS